MHHQLIHHDNTRGYEICEGFVGFVCTFREEREMLLNVNSETIREPPCAVIDYLNYKHEPYVLHHHAGFALIIINIKSFESLKGTV